MTSRSPNPFTRDATVNSRALHWVLKIGNLKKSIDFFEQVIGLRVLRHEEFSSGCEATCNGPYGGAWSKTMVGFGDEKDNFVLELTYNYGIDGYKFGNDLQFIALHHSSAISRAIALGYVVEGDTIVGPDNYRFKIISPIAGRAEQFVCVGLKSSNIKNSLAYWCGVLGLQRFELPASLASIVGDVALVGFAEHQSRLLLIDSHDGQAVDHALSSGRIAFACNKVPPIYELIITSGDKVLTPPLTLPTPGKADVVVTILQDRDDYEICFVEDLAFYDLATPLFDVIDFADRAKRGGDGNPLPKSVDHVEYTSRSTVKAVTELDEVVAYLAENVDTKIVVLDFHAAWCKNCIRISPLIASLAETHADNVLVLGVDVDTAGDVALEFDVSTLPRLLFFSKDSKVPVEDYIGSDEKIITDKFVSLCK